MKDFRRLIALILSLALALSLTACKHTGESTAESTGASRNSGESSSSSASTEETAETLCEEIAYAPTASGLYVDRTGRIKSGEITAFDNSGFTVKRYDEAGLRQYVTGWINDFNAAKDREAVKLQELTVANKQAKLIMDYDSVDSFMEFQGADFGVTQLQIISVKDAAANFQLTSLRDTNGKAVTPLEAVKNEKYTVVVVSGNFQLTTSGPVAFLSNALTLSGPNTVRINTKNTCYIIFK